MALLLAAAVAADAQQQPLPSGRRFRADVNVVSVNVTVTDAEGRLVTGLPREAFEIVEDGRPQPLTAFTNERVPVSLALLLDASDSMRGRRIIEARTAVGHFLSRLLAETDEFMVMAFNHVPRVLADWSEQTTEVRTPLDTLHASGGTAAYDAVMAALPLVEERSRPRAAIVLISDGADTASDATLRDVRSALLRSPAFVYAIGIDPPGTQAINRRVNPAALREITDANGGRTLVVHDTSELADATGTIAQELNSQYLLGFTPTHPPDNVYHSLRVRITAEHGGSQLKVRARHGYVADSAASRSRR